jgi:molybdenum cofactor cytidylyltransferase
MITESRSGQIVIPIVLAAGASRRMGRPKALLDFDGRSCLDLVLDACGEPRLGAPIIVTGPVTHPAAEAIRTHVARGDRTALCAVNQRPEDGQLSSLQAGLRALPDAATAFAAAFLIFPIDYPLVRREDIGTLLDAFETRDGAALIFVPAFNDRRGHPVLVDAALTGEFLALGIEASARTVLGAHVKEMVLVPAMSDRVLCDMDTPADYERCLERFRRSDFK